MQTEHSIQSNSMVFLSHLDNHAQNYRQHGEHQLAKLRESLKRFGQARSVVAQEKPDGRYTIVAGHGIVAAARQLGFTQLRVDVLPSSWTAESIKGFLIAENRLSLDAEENEALLANLLQEQVDSGHLLDALGSSQAELQALLSEVLFDDEPKEVPQLPTRTQDDLRREMTISQGRVAEIPTTGRTVTVDAEGLAPPVGRTPDQYLQLYENTMLRQIVLIYQKEKYANMLDRFSIIRKNHKLDTNAQVVEYLLDRYYAEEEVAADA